MRIISHFKDYYDVGQAYGADPSLVYEREKREATVESSRLVRGGATDSLEDRLNDYLYYPRHDSRKYPDHPGLIPRVIGFCGRLYPLFLQSDIEVSRFGSLYYSADYDFADEYYYSAEAVLDRAEELKLDARNKNPSSWGPKRVRDFFDRWSREDDGLFLEHRAPCFVVCYSFSWMDPVAREQLIINPRLADLQFYQIKHPVAAYQEIAQYLGNVLVQRDEPLQVSDEHRAQQHGFDKMSFRREPGEKKRRKSQ